MSEKKIGDVKMIAQTIEWWEKQSDELLAEIDELEKEILSGNYSLEVLSSLDKARAKLRILIRRGENEYEEVSRIVDEENNEH
jgi:cob(I)alamin adenosyltransferase